jgi:hypothetical protein
MILLFQDLDGLTCQQKLRIIHRYIEMTERLRRRSFFYALVFHIGRATVTVGSLIVPALLSIQYTDPQVASMSNNSYQIYWATWIVSLLVTTFNGVLTLFKVDKKYYFLHTTLEQLQSEAWQYIHLSGKYGGFYTKGRIPTHENQYVFFCHTIEKIKLKQVEEEYFKLTDASSHGSDKQFGSEAAGTSQPPESKLIAGLYAPTPDQQGLLLHQQQLARAIHHPSAINLPVLVEDANTASKEPEGRNVAP